MLFVYVDFVLLCYLCVFVLCCVFLCLNLFELFKILGAFAMLLNRLKSKQNIKRFNNVIWTFQSLQSLDFLFIFDFWKVCKPFTFCKRSSRLNSARRSKLCKPWMMICSSSARFSIFQTLQALQALLFVKVSKICGQKRHGRFANTISLIHLHINTYKLILRPDSSR